MGVNGVTDREQSGMRTLAIIGSRGYPIDSVRYFLERELHGYERVVSGGARGVDRVAESFAADRGLNVVSYRPHGPDFWVDTAGPTKGQSGRSFFVAKWVDGVDTGAVCDNGDPLRFATFADAAKARNWWIARDAEDEIAFWDGTSSGTAHGIAAFCRLHGPPRIHLPGDS